MEQITLRICPPTSEPQRKFLLKTQELYCCESRFNVRKAITGQSSIIFASIFARPFFFVSFFKVHFLACGLINPKKKPYLFEKSTEHRDYKSSLNSGIVALYSHFIEWPISLQLIFCDAVAVLSG